MQNLEIVDNREVLGFDFKVYGDFDNPLFLAKDVANWIGHSNVTDMISRIDEDEVTKLNLGGQKGDCNFLTEDGLYEVLMQSRKPIAKEFKKEVKKILKDLRKGNSVVVNTGSQQADLYTQLMSASMKAISEVLNQNMASIKEELRQEKEEIRSVISYQEIIHDKQIEKTRELIGFKCKNTNEMMQLLKTKISDLKGYTITARGDYHYQLAKSMLFSKYGVYKWEDLQIDYRSQVHADIDSIEDLDSICFG